ncbi:hypothetical protein SCAB_84562 [Streptomyces scabiei 87.22]|uniref:Uncharacterized protein n=1 Tax=Streptomyces scabiei (strain 87.22) TaxID=680198 RepID=C9Z017_STRSW|nr:hypothetical protein SCAB_84562 [Streptomyces scabiei 87.22]
MARAAFDRSRGYGIPRLMPLPLVMWLLPDEVSSYTARRNRSEQDTRGVRQAIV